MNCSSRSRTAGVADRDQNAGIHGSVAGGGRGELPIVGLLVGIADADAEVLGVDAAIDRGGGLVDRRLRGGGLSGRAEGAEPAVGQPPAADQRRDGKSAEPHFERVLNRSDGEGDALDRLPGPPTPQPGQGLLDDGGPLLGRNADGVAFGPMAESRDEGEQKSSAREHVQAGEGLGQPKLVATRQQQGRAELEGWVELCRGGERDQRVRARPGEDIGDPQRVESQWPQRAHHGRERVRVQGGGAEPDGDANLHLLRPDGLGPRASPWAMP